MNSVSDFRAQIKNMSGNAVPEYKVQETKRSRLILLHYGIFKIGWDWMILFCTFYIAITVPYNAAFVMTSESFNERQSIVTDVIVEMLLIIGWYRRCVTHCSFTVYGPAAFIRGRGLRP